MLRSSIVREMYSANRYGYFATEYKPNESLNHSVHSKSRTQIENVSRKSIHWCSVYSVVTCGQNYTANCLNNLLGQKCKLIHRVANLKANSATKTVMFSDNAR